MISLTFDKALARFFDRKKVVDAADRATLDVLSKFGAYVRQSARVSIRNNKSISVPGSPPNSHVGTLRKLIFFVFDATRKSVVIGPTLFRPDSKVPSLLEYGGTASRPRKNGSVRRMVYRARPFMRPAFEVNLDAVPGLWKYAVRP